MAGGWSDDGAVNKQIDATIEDAVARARDHLGHGESAEFCDECGEPIPEARRQALAGVRYCVNCQSKKDKKMPSKVVITGEVAKTVSFDKDLWGVSCAIRKITGSINFISPAKISSNSL